MTELERAAIQYADALINFGPRLAQLRKADTDFYGPAKAYVVAHERLEDTETELHRAAKEYALRAKGE